MCVLHHSYHFQIHIHTDKFDGYHFWYKNVTVAVIKIHVYSVTFHVCTPSVLRYNDIITVLCIRL